MAHSDSIEPQSLLEQADGLTEAGHHGEAAKLYADLCRHHPENVAAWIGLAVALLRQQRFLECIEAAASALALDSSQPRPYLVAVAALTHMGRHDNALRAADGALALTPDDPKALNSKASVLLNLGRFAEALPLLERALRIEPTHSLASLNRGIVLYRLDQPRAALEAFDQLLAVEPRHPEALINRSSVLVALGQPEEALQTADAALSIWSDSVIALLNRAAALLRLRRPREALATVDRLLQLDSRHLKGLINKALALLTLGDFQEALATTQNALAQDAAHPDALELHIQALLGLRRYADAVAEGQAVLRQYPGRPALQLGLAKALLGLKRLAEAEDCVDAVLASGANLPDAVVLKAEILWSRRQWEAAWTWIEQAIAADPNQAQLWTAKTALLLAKERYAEAWAAAERALVLEPEHAQATINGIAALNGLHRFAEALAMIDNLLERGVRDWQVCANRGGALAGLERFEEARQAFATARALDEEAFLAFRQRHQVDGVPPDALMPELDPRAEYLAFTLSRLLEHCGWDQYDAVVARAMVLIQQSLAEGKPAPIPPFKAIFLPFAPELTAAVARSHGQFLASGMAAAGQQLQWVAPKPAVERLRIGYVSADFRNHPTGHLIGGLFQLHDRQRFEICIYALGKDDGSAHYRQIRANADRFTDLTGMSNAEAATRINADGVHILIDLMGYTAGARPEIFALRPVPVQASYLGYPGSLGAPFIPYIIADPVVLPEELRPCFTEQPVYLPECYQVNDRGQEIAETGVRRVDQGLPEHGFVFCGFNQIQKLEPILFAVWMRILDRTPGSVLWLYAHDREARERLRATAAVHGVSGERLIFAEYLPKPQHLERHRLADLFLDTRLCNAHTTASDALWAGLPVLTCLGETFPARVAASLLHAVGMPELITHSLEEYEEWAVRLATQPAELAALREKLAYNRLRTPLFDTERFARHLERAYERMWERHVQGLPPAPLWVAPLPSTT
jgi:predicted O-linked N-acetylglucosamine transferase (SPINDLY family)